LRKNRSGISATIGLLILVIIIAAAFYIAIPMAGTAPTTTSAGTNSASSSSSGGASSTTTPPGTTGTLSISIAQPLIVAPNIKEAVTVSLSAIGTVSGNYTFSATGLPSGVNATFSPSSVSLPSQLQSGVTMTLAAASGASVVNSSITVQAVNGPKTFKQQFSLDSVAALVFIQGNAFNPNSVTVPTGTKVYWLNLDPSNSPDLGPDMHDVTATDGSFSSGTGNLGQYALYGHTFTSAGTIQYQSKQQGGSMSGQVIVTG
jgi:plastocyanin